MLDQLRTGERKYLLFASSNITAMPRAGRMSSDILWPTFGPGEGGFVHEDVHVWLDSCYRPSAFHTESALQINRAWILSSSTWRLDDTRQRTCEHTDGGILFWLITPKPVSRSYVPSRQLRSIPLIIRNIQKLHSKTSQDSSIR